MNLLAITVAMTITVTMEGIRSITIMGLGFSRPFAVMVTVMSNIGVSVSVSMTVVAVSRFSSSGGLSRSFTVMVTVMSSISIRMSVSITMAVTMSVSISGLSRGHGGKGNKGKSDTLHNAADYDYVL